MDHQKKAHNMIKKQKNDVLKIIVIQNPAARHKKSSSIEGCF